MKSRQVMAGVACALLGPLAPAAKGEDVPAAFTIEITDCSTSGNGFTASQMSMLKAAAARWEEVITHTPCGTGLVNMNVSAVEKDGTDGALASAYFTDAVECDGGQLIVTDAVIDFDVEDLEDLEASGRLHDVAVHEMGHALGFGTLLLIEAGCTACVISGSGAWSGVICPATAATYTALSGDDSTIFPEIIEVDGDAGNVCGHFDETLFGHEVMTGWAEEAGIDMPLSALTVAVMEDLGFTVDYSKADEYTLPAVAASASTSDSSGPASTSDSSSGGLTRRLRSGRRAESKTSSEKGENPKTRKLGELSSGDQDRDVRVRDTKGKHLGFMSTRHPGRFTRGRRAKA